VTATTFAYRSSPRHEWRARQRPESVSPPARAPQREPVARRWDTASRATVAWTVRYEKAVGRGASAEVEGVVIPFIGLDDLIATNRTGRLQDAADIEVLEEIRLR
jgi:hypothetical protein